MENKEEEGLMKVGGMVGEREAENLLEALEEIPILLEDSPSVIAGSHSETLGFRWGSLMITAENPSGRIQTDEVLVLDPHFTTTVDLQDQTTLLSQCIVSGDLLPLVGTGLQGQVTQSKAGEGQCKDLVVLGTLHRDGGPGLDLQVVLHQSFSEGPH